MAKSQEASVGEHEVWELARECCFLGNNGKTQPAVGKTPLNLMYLNLFSL